MRVVVISCQKYADTWNPFLSLFQKFYGGPITLLTDATDYRQWSSFIKVAIESGNWCQMLSKFAARSNEPVLLFQDDFFLNSPVRHELIGHAEELLGIADAGCVRLYPCPGADVSSMDRHFGRVGFGAEYRISCQAAIWKADYLARVAGHANGSPRDFEILGTAFSRSLHDPIFAFNREMQPWPVEYICSAVTRGEWNPDAITLCKKYDIEIDISRRPVMGMASV